MIRLFLLLMMMSPTIFGQTDSLSQTAGIILNSTPPNVKVFSGQKLLGLTPIFEPLDFKFYPLVLKKTGYDDFSISDTAIKLVNLKALTETSGSVVRIDKTQWVFNDQNNKIWWTVGAMVATGITSAYFKHQANISYKKYTETLNPTYLKETNSYDTIAGVSLGLTEIGFGTLLYFLFWD